MLKSSYRKSSSLRWLWLTIFIFILDQGSKDFIIHHFYVGQTFPLLPFLNIHVAENAGAAFDFLAQSGSWKHSFFIVLTSVVCVILLIWLARSKGQPFQAFALSLILGGAIGNFWDRVHLGYVNDFIDFHLHTWHFATFNIADSAISIGVFILIMQFLFSSKKK